jgi:hypothetical protein
MGNRRTCYLRWLKQARLLDIIPVQINISDTCVALRPCEDISTGAISGQPRLKDTQMTNPLRSVAFLLPVLLGLSACDELALANDPEALAELRAQKSCVAAVERQTGVSGATINTTLPVVEINQYVVDVPNAKSWTCYTTPEGKAAQLVEFRD